MSKVKKEKDCKCISETASLIKEKVTADNSGVKGFKIQEGHWVNESFYPFHRGYYEYRLFTTFEKKDGTTSARKKKIVNIFPTFCPFCGQKFPEAR